MHRAALSYIAGTNTKKGEDISMIKQIYSTLKDNADDSIIFYFTTWLFDPCTLQILIRHLFDNRGELTLPDFEIEAIAKMILPDMVAFFSAEEGRKEYEEWLAERRTKYSKDSEEKGKLRKDGTQTA